MDDWKWGFGDNPLVCQIGLKILLLFIPLIWKLCKQYYTIDSSDIKKEDDENHDPTFNIETEVGDSDFKVDFKVDTSKVKKELVEMESFLEQGGNVDDLEKPHKCNLCDARYAKNFHLKRHIETVHEGLKPHICSICNKGFAELCNLKHHIATVHEGKRPHQCTICGKRFAKNNQLNI